MAEDQPIPFDHFDVGNFRSDSRINAEAVETQQRHYHVNFISRRSFFEDFKIDGVAVHHIVFDHRCC